MHEYIINWLGPSYSTRRDLQNRPVFFEYSFCFIIEYTTYWLFEPCKSSVRLFFDILHGIPQLGVAISDALELGILIGFDGQLKQESNKEWFLLHDVIKQLCDAKLGGRERLVSNFFPMDSEKFYFRNFLTHFCGKSDDV